MLLSVSIIVISILFSQLASGQNNNVYCTLSTWNPHAALHNQDVNAGAFGFYLGLSGPSTYCPVDPMYCPPGNQTVVYANSMSLSVIVPGGQQTYVAPSGSISYTQAHSVYMPPGSYVGGFTSFTWEDDTGANKTILNWSTPGNPAYNGILACPLVNASIYKLYARTPAFNESSCIELTDLLSKPQPNNTPGAWQYT